MLPEDFKAKAQEIYRKNNGFAGEEGHVDIDDLMRDCLESLGYKEGTDILFSMNGIWYS